MFVIKKYKIYNKKENKTVLNETPRFTDKVNLKAKWTYAKTDKISGYDISISEGHQEMTNHMIKLYDILKKKDIKMSLAVYPWPHQLKNDIENSLHVRIWENFCKNRCENFINYFPYFFNFKKNSSYIETYKKYYFKNDPHFNKEGHIVLADKLIELLK